ncbi:MAG: hypothetical protein ACI4NW_13365 [Stenotrophomonas sp.]
MPVALLPLLLFLCALLLPGSTRAQDIRRCSNADGVSVFTDKPCELLQARPRISARPARPAGAAVDSNINPQRQCPQRLSQLVEQVQQAIVSGDSNRLSTLYWWAGHSQGTAPQLLQRLEAMVQRPLLDIAPVYPAPRPAISVSTLPAVATGPGMDTPSSMALSSGSAPAQPAGQRPRPYALRIVQTLGSGSTPTSSVLQLRRHYGCFWISF